MHLVSSSFFWGWPKQAKAWAAHQRQMVGNVKTLLCDNDESKGASHDTFSYSLLIRFNLRLDSFFRNPFPIIFHPVRKLGVFLDTVKLGDKERLDSEQTGNGEPF